MRYIKTYENKVQYEVGDYVKLKFIPEYVEQNINRDDELNLYVKILGIEHKQNNTADDIFIFQTHENKNIYGYISLINRKLNLKDTKELKMRTSAKKYNL